MFIYFNNIIFNVSTVVITIIFYINYISIIIKFIYFLFLLLLLLNCNYYTILVYLFLIVFLIPVFDYYYNDI